MITLADIREARARIQDAVRRTPLVEAAPTVAPLADGARVFLKLECLQVTGSFKARGALNKLRSLKDAEVKRGIVTASGGNHGIAVAYVGRVAGTPAQVFVPSNISPAKAEKIRRFGADLRIVGTVWDEANREALAAAERGRTYFHPFADPAVMAGQGTVALEMLEDAPDLDTLLVAIGGGGLIAGIAVAAKALNPGIRIVGVEPTGAPTMKASLDAGRIVELPSVTTKVPTMAAKMTAEPNFEIAQRHVERVVLVEDSDMQAASEWLWREMGLAADLSGAASVAALLTGRYQARPGERIGALVCGAGAEGTGA
jgi:threonine dehydratase